ncbi:MAG: hypothetical protein R6V10_16490 [bacterium]
MELKSHRKLMALVQGTIWLVAGAAVAGGLLFTYFEEGGSVSPFPAAVYVLIAPVLTGIIGAVTGPNQARKDYREGKIELPPGALEKGLELTPPRRPMWLVPMVFASLLALPFAAAGVVLILVGFPEGAGRISLTATAGLAAGGSAALCAWFSSGRELIRYAAHQPAGALAFGRYALIEHVSGNSLINVIINAGIGYILFHQGPHHPEPLVSVQEFVPEILVMCAIVAVAVSIGAGVQAAADVLEKRALPPSPPLKKHPGAISRILIYLAMAPVLAGLLWGALTLAGLQSISLASALVIKAALAGVVAAIAVFLAARWSAAKTAVS